ncbi:hypothetical protein HD554DRAFT_2030656 [Boletus coccyginus]|nr:hypothetical protein HD554DRAFT_2030656 [Boletus coccyginus]
MQTTFRCWICGEDVDSIFSITVLKTANVNALKDAIKAFRSHRFRDVTASDLKLYSFPSHDDPELAIQRWTPGDGKELSSTKKLTKVASKYLIVVEGPDITLNCWVRGRSMDYFPVKISITETVGALKKAIRNENPEGFRGVDAKDLALFKVSLAFSEDGSLEGVLDARTISSLGKHLQSSQRLSAIFGPELPDNELHVIVQGMWHY